MVRYTIIIEKAPDGGFGAYIPDLPGCIGMGETKSETIDNTIESIRFHLEGMKLEGIPIPEPLCEAENLVFSFNI